MRVRQAQWMYLGPILAAPVAHWAVTLYPDAKTPRQKQLVLGVGIVGSTVMTLTMRLYLMVHAGYPGGPGTGLHEREVWVTPEEKQRMTNPNTAELLSKALRGFG
jgi:hypothetical protein